MSTQYNRSPCSDVSVLVATRLLLFIFKALIFKINCFNRNTIHKQPKITKLDYHNEIWLVSKGKRESGIILKLNIFVNCPTPALHTWTRWASRNLKIRLRYQVVEVKYGVKSWAGAFFYFRRFYARDKIPARWFWLFSPLKKCNLLRTPNKVCVGRVIRFTVHAGTCRHFSIDSLNLSTEGIILLLFHRSCLHLYKSLDYFSFQFGNRRFTGGLFKILCLKSYKELEWDIDKGKFIGC